MASDSFKQGKLYAFRGDAVPPNYQQKKNQENHWNTTSSRDEQGKHNLKMTE